MERLLLSGLHCTALHPHYSSWKGPTINSFILSVDSWTLSVGKTARIYRRSPWCQLHLPHSPSFSLDNTFSSFTQIKSFELSFFACLFQYLSLNNLSDQNLVVDICECRKNRKPQKESKATSNVAYQLIRGDQIDFRFDFDLVFRGKFDK